ncbi:hypothetical protein [Haliangium sp.]|uniref:hypothetical protein n=1 Tax=Haliangium sp. TaxID=2663208 RepID=UPI003D0B49A8
MKPRTLAIDIPILALGEEMFHTGAMLAAYPFLTAQVEQYTPLFDEWNQIMTQELDLLREQSAAEARVITVDDTLDYLCMAISSTLLAESGGRRGDPHYQRYFGAAPPSRLKRPILGRQLEVMRTWVPSLTAPESSEALRNYGGQLAEAITSADAAVAVLIEAKRKQADFEVGPRKRFIDKLNAHRLRLYGELGEMPLAHPEQRLSRDFGYRFFLRGQGSHPPTVAELEHKILRTRDRLTRYEEQLARLIEEQERDAESRHRAEIVENSNRLAALEAEQARLELEQAEVAARLAELRADVEPEV